MVRPLAAAVLLLLVPAAVAQPRIDGMIDANEYDSTATFAEGSYVIHWTVHGQDIYFAIQARTTGWVALGIRPTQAMKDADMILGSVSATGSPSIIDAYSTGANGPHPADTSLGGTSDVASYGGSQRNGITIFEFRRALATGDKYDKDIPAQGNVMIIWALGSSDIFTDYHTERGAGMLTMRIPEAIPIIAILCLGALLGRPAGRALLV